MNIISKVATLPYTPQSKNAEPASPAVNPQTKAHGTSSYSSGVVAVPGTIDTTTIGLSEGQLRRQGIECLASVLRSLVTWGITSGKTSADHSGDPGTRSQTGEETGHDSMTPDSSLDKLATSTGSTEVLRQSTPNVVDDPTRFENAKQKKTTLLEGIKKFNFKPKRVSYTLNGDKVLSTLSCIGYPILSRNWLHPQLITARYCALSSGD